MQPNTNNTPIEEFNKLLANVIIETEDGRHYRPCSIRHFDGVHVILSTIGHPLKYTVSEIQAAQQGGWTLRFEDGYDSYLNVPRRIRKEDKKLPSFWQPIWDYFNYM